MRLVLTTDDGIIIEEWTNLERYNLGHVREQAELVQGIQNAIVEFQQNTTTHQERR